MSVTISTEDFSVADAYTRLRQQQGVGAVCIFTGLVRQWLADNANNGKPILSLTLEHYPGMTEAKLTEIRDAAMGRWDLLDAMIIHRIGRLLPSEQIVLVGTAAQHRQPAFAAAQFIMDYLKTEAPFWKAEETENGSQWVEARPSDAHATKSWQSK